MKKIILSLVSLTFLFTASAWAQKFPATLKMHDGSTQTGIVSLPKNTEKKISFTPEGGKTIKVPSADIALMTITNKNGYISEFEYVPVFTTRSVINATYDKVQGYAWLVIKTRGYVTLYSSHFSSFWEGRELPEFSHYCRRESEKAVSLIATSSPSPTSFGHNKNFKKLANVYFADDQTIIDKIADGTFTNKNLVELVTEYNSRNNNKYVVPSKPKR